MVRQFFDFLIFLSHNTLLAFLGFMLLWVAGSRVFGLDRKLAPLIRRIGGRGLLLTSSLLLLLFLLISGWYLSLSGFAGEVEPMVSSLSWMVQDGYPLYHDLESPSRYSVLYGPSVFLTNGLFLKILGPSVFSAKVASSLAALASLLLLYAALARHRKDLVAVAMVGLAILYFWGQGFSVYLVRPDSLMIFAVSFGLYCALKVRRIFAILAVGTIMGFAINLKIHGGFYFLPVLSILFYRFGWRSLFPVGVLTGMSVMAPFSLFSQISLDNYILWLRNAMGHGLGLASLLDTVRYSAQLLLPMAALLLLNRSAGRWLAVNSLLMACMLGSIAGTLVLSAKPGAGLVHLLPLVPTVLYVVSLLIRELPGSNWSTDILVCSRARLGQGAAVAIFLTIVLAGSVHEYRVCKLVHWENLETGDLAGDIADIQATYPGLSLGMAVGGENAHFRRTWMRPLLVFSGNPLMLDPIAVMECQLTGHELPPSTYAALAQGQVAVWLVPKAQRPFAKANWYPPHAPVFSATFMEHFQNNYTPRSQSRFFDLWIWNGLSGEALGEPALASSERKSPVLSSPH